MEIYRDGVYWYFKNTRGPVPDVLKGAWTSKEFAEKALMRLQDTIKARAVNVTQRQRNLKERYAANQTATTS